MKKLSVAALLLLAIGIGSASADCTFGGETYPEGATIPGYVCQNGSWVPTG